MKKYLLIVALTLCGALSASAQVRFTSVDTDALHAMALKAQKLVFIDIFATWCQPCNQMDRTVFSTSEVGEFMNSRFVCAKYNIDFTTGKKLARKYKVHSIPTYLIFNVEGELLGRMSGAMTQSEFLDNMRTMLDRIKAEGK